MAQNRHVVDRDHNAARASVAELLPSAGAAGLRADVTILSSTKGFSHVPFDADFAEFYPMNFQRPPLTDDVQAVRAEIAQVLTLHQAMFQKLLFERSALPLELAELFEDAANVYLGFSEAISAQHLLARTPRGERCEVPRDIILPLQG